MSRIAALAQSRVRDIPAYRPGRTGTSSMSGKLSSNEAPLGPAPGVREALAGLRSVHRYPQEVDVSERLAAYVGTCPDRMLLTNGSDELCFLLATLLLGSGRTAVVGEPCYQIDATVSMSSGSTVRRVPLRDGAHDLAAMAKAAEGASVIWLPSPHNPTGVTADPGSLERFLAAAPADCAVVLDEAYRSFADPDRRPDVTRLLHSYPNLIVQRTLSKDWALAGLRIGYALASEPIIDALRRIRPPFSVNSAALLAADAALNHEEWRAMTVSMVRHQRDLLESELDCLGIKYFPSQANFVAASLDHGRLMPALTDSGLAVRPGDDLGIPGWVRISIGWAPQMALLRATLRRLARSGALEQ